MKIFLDDVRNPPDNTWVTVRTAMFAISLLNSYKVEAISLDHDLGLDPAGNVMPSGYDVVCEIERLVHTNPKWIPPVMMIHSANPVGRANMQRAIDAINRFRAGN